MTSSMQGVRRRRVADPDPSPGPGLAAVRDGHWQIVTASAQRGPDEDLGLPGPWRVVEPGRMVAELSPAWLLADDGPAARADLLAWAAGTARGALPQDAPAAAAEQVARVSAELGLAIDAGTRALVVQVAHDGQRLALRAALGRVPEELAPARAAWLEAVLASGRRHWRLVRLGVEPASGQVRAEVDLSGAPPSLLDALLRHGLAAVRHVAAWVLPGIDLCLDPDLSSALLARPPAGDVPGPEQPPFHGDAP